MIKEKILFTKEECEIIESYRDSSVTNWETNDRKYNSWPIICSPENEWIFNKLKRFVEDDSDIKIKSSKETIHFHKFTKGDWFDKHNDVRDGRIYAVGVLLNVDFTGGDFKLYNPSEYTISKETGNTYIFDVRIEHEITQILSGERHSLLWFLQKEHLDLKIDKLI
jgi:hypothetical protein